MKYVIVGRPLAKSSHCDVLVTDKAGIKDGLLKVRGDSVEVFELRESGLLDGADLDWDEVLA